MRKAKTKDIPKIMVLLKDSFSHAWEKTGRKIDEKFVEQNFKEGIQNDVTIIEEKSGKLVAFGWAKHGKDFFGNKFGEIKLLLVSPNAQNKGLGTELITKLEKALKEKETRLECLTSNRATKLYKKQGFKKFLETLRKTKHLAQKRSNCAN